MPDQTTFYKFRETIWGWKIETYTGFTVAVGRKRSITHGKVIIETLDKAFWEEIDKEAKISNSEETEN